MQKLAALPYISNMVTDALKSVYFKPFNRKPSSGSITSTNEKTKEQTKLKRSPPKGGA